MTQPIVIVDYGLANLRSVQKAFEHVQAPAVITSDPNRVGEAEKIVLPGVGAYRDAIHGLRELGLDTAVRDHIAAGKPFLGICLGLQLLFERSFEDGEYPGLGIFAGDVVRFPNMPGLKVPHMGWNQLRIRKPSAIWEGLGESPSVYFVHSYFVVPRDVSLIACETDYPDPFTSAIEQGNVIATQFHPEKSQRVGLSILHKFATLY